ncbi:testisin-like isoform X2 [Argopecten irradians]|uniref:testisin-like isoform X2 n=1 Tax=Argopecten irradians TaxID=31199 RepID=UPI003718C939
MNNLPVPLFITHRYRGRTAPVPRITEGNAAGEESWPWQVLILYKNKQVCGGTLLCADTVLTSAYCVRYSTGPLWIRVVVGMYNRRKNEKITRGQKRFQVKKIILHPDYDVYANDIAIIKLTRRVKFNKYIQPIPRLADDTMDFLNKTCYTTGWGIFLSMGNFKRPNVLQEVQTPVVPNAMCQPLFDPFNIALGDDTICTKDIPKGACTGDEGGPLQCLVNKKWVHAGVTSFNTGRCGEVTIYSRTSFHRQWILENMK